MAATMKIKLELVLKLDDIEQVLKSRGIATTQANVKRLVKLVQDTPISANSEFYEGIPTDRKILLMYGFTLSKKEQHSNETAS